MGKRDMTKILLTGCNGRMGKVITELAAADPEVEIVAGIDVAGTCAGAYPVHGSFDEVAEEADVIVDFSSPKVFDAMMDYAVRKQVPVVICTTGLSDEQIGRIEEDAQKVALLRSANMSLGINLLLKLVKEAAKKLAPEGFDIEIVERHHNQKKDAPSGTALALAESINEGMDGAYHFTYDRSQRMEKRDPQEIGISAVRGGNIPGTHEVIFAGPDEVIEFNHIAYSRGIFGKGALSAAKFLAGKAPKLYSMADVIG
jgi:4-hydroxy-tetrahydrodipicolinate reductase